MTNDYWKRKSHFSSGMLPLRGGQSSVEGPIPMHILSAVSGFDVLEIKEHMDLEGIVGMSGRTWRKK